MPAAAWRWSAADAGGYLAEFDFRYSTRDVDDTARTHTLLNKVGGKRLTYKPLRDGR